MHETIAEQYLKETFKQHIFVCEEGFKTPSGRPHLPDLRHITLAADFLTANPITERTTASALAQHITLQLNTGITPGAVICALTGLGYTLEQYRFDAIVHGKVTVQKAKRAQKSTPKIDKKPIKKSSKANKTKSQ